MEALYISPLTNSSWDTQYEKKIIPIHFINYRPINNYMEPTAISFSSIRSA